MLSIISPCCLTINAISCINLKFSAIDCYNFDILLFLSIISSTRYFNRREALPIVLDIISWSKPFFFLAIFYASWSSNSGASAFILCKLVLIENFYISLCIFWVYPIMKLTYWTMNCFWYIWEWVSGSSGYYSILFLTISVRFYRFCLNCKI